MPYIGYANSAAGDEPQLYGGSLPQSGNLEYISKTPIKDNGIGNGLMSRMLDKLDGIRQILLMTDAGEASSRLHAWYQSHGFQPYEALGNIEFAIFNS